MRNEMNRHSTSIGRSCNTFTTQRDVIHAHGHTGSQKNSRSAIRFGLLLWQDARVKFIAAIAMTDPSFIVPMARAAEDAGYDVIAVPDSIAYPLESDSTYPYTPDGSR